MMSSQSGQSSTPTSPATSATPRLVYAAVVGGKKLMPSSSNNNDNNNDNKSGSKSIDGSGDGTVPISLSSSDAFNTTDEIAAPFDSSTTKSSSSTSNNNNISSSNESDSSSSSNSNQNSSVSTKEEEEVVDSSASTKEQEQEQEEEEEVVEEEVVEGKVFVGGLPWNTTEETLSSYFVRFGAIKEVTMLIDRKTNHPRGFAFIRFAKASDANAALVKSDHFVDGRKVDVKVALPKNKIPLHGAFGTQQPQQQQQQTQIQMHQVQQMQQLLVQAQIQTQIKPLISLSDGGSSSSSSSIIGNSNKNNNSSSGAKNSSGGAGGVFMNSNINQSPPYTSTPGSWRKIFVGGLDADVTDAEFRAHFANFGAITESMIMIDKATGKSRKFGFVTFEFENTAERVCLMGHTIRSKSVEVKRAEPRDNFSEHEHRGPRMFPVHFQNGDGNSYNRHLYGGIFNQGGMGIHQQRSGYQQPTQPNSGPASATYDGIGSTLSPSATSGTTSGGQIASGGYGYEHDNVQFVGYPNWNIPPGSNTYAMMGYYGYNTYMQPMQVQQQQQRIYNSVDAGQIPQRHQPTFLPSNSGVSANDLSTSMGNMNVNGQIDNTYNPNSGANPYLNAYPFPYANHGNNSHGRSFQHPHQYYKKNHNFKKANNMNPKDHPGQNVNISNKSGGGDHSDNKNNSNSNIDGSNNIGNSNSSNGESPSHKSPTHTYATSTSESTAALNIIESLNPSQKHK